MDYLSISSLIMHPNNFNTSIHIGKASCQMRCECMHCSFTNQKKTCVYLLFLSLFCITVFYRTINVQNGYCYMVIIVYLVVP